MSLLRLYIIIVLISGLCSCGQSENELLPSPVKDVKGNFYFDSKHDFVKWNSQSGNVHQHKSIGEFTFSSKYLSPHVLALQETHGDSINEAKFNESLAHYQDLLYFRLTISNKTFPKELLKYHLTSRSHYSERVKYASFNLNKDVCLTNGKDTVPCAIHEFERSFNIQSGLNFLLTFPKINTSRGVALIYHDRLFDHGLIKFRFSKEISNTPYLKLK